MFGSIGKLLMEASALPDFHLRIRELGLFEIKQVKARDRVNPRTGAVGPVPARTMLSFRFAKTLRDLGRAPSQARVAPGQEAP